MKRRFVVPKTDADLCELSIKFANEMLALISHHNILLEGFKRTSKDIFFLRKTCLDVMELLRQGKLRDSTAYKRLAEAWVLSIQYGTEEEKLQSRRSRTIQLGMAKASRAGKQIGRPGIDDLDRADIIKRWRSGKSYREISNLTLFSHSTVARIVQEANRVIQKSKGTKGL